MDIAEPGEINLSGRRAPCQRAQGLSSEGFSSDARSAYGPPGASGIGAERDGGLPGFGAGRAGEAPCDRRGGVGGAAVSAVPVVSWGGCASGSAVMMLTGGIEADDGK